MKNLINILVTCALIAISIYVIMFIPTVVDFTQVTIRLEDNDTIYQFLIYLPLILSIFNGILVLCNIWAKNIVITVMNIIISLGIVIYLFMNVMGSVDAILAIKEKLDYIKYVNIGCIGFLIIETILYFIKPKKLSNSNR